MTKGIYGVGGSSVSHRALSAGVLTKVLRGQLSLTCRVAMVEYRKEMGRHSSEGSLQYIISYARKWLQDTIRRNEA